MPSYNLAQPEEQVVVTWLFEPLGYLDAESVSLAQTSSITTTVRQKGTLSTSS